MNYLAHAYLSFNDPDILIGNMISDFVKGKTRFDYPEGIQKGIMLHRQIDSFTDFHPATQKAKEVFRPYYRLYSGPMMDIIYDHFLANDESMFPANALHQFTLDTYATIDEQSAHLPARFAHMFLYMRTENWLYNYRKHEGMEKSLRGLVRRSAFLTESDTAYKLYLDNYEELRECYQMFMPDVKSFAKESFRTLVG
jgi:acyl carrier protein phosphodiesterase